MARPQKVFEKYGKPWPVEWSPLQVELECMIMDHPVDKGGLGKLGHLRNAMQLLWPHLYAGEAEPGVLRWRDEIEQLAWAWCNYRVVSVIGHASAAKTHTFAHILAAAYLADPFNTICTLTSTHLPGLRKRFWSEMVSALTTNAATTPNDWHIRSHDLTVRPSMNPREDKYVIEGIAVDRGEEAVEKLQGNHSRMHRYVAIDEAQGTPKAIFEAAANLMTDQDFRLGMLANPTKKFAEFGTWCEPANGWSTVDPDVDTWWETARGGVCIRFDGMRSPNIRLGRTVFPFLITPSYLDQVERSFGKDSPRWWIFVRGWFPPDGLVGYVFPTSVLERGTKRIEFMERPKMAAALDPAFEGGDECILMLAEYGRANGSDYAMNVLHDIPIKVAAKADGDPLDFLIAQEVIKICEQHHVAPSDFIMDTTGAGRGVANYLRQNWSQDIQQCQFGQAASDRILKVGESDTCTELFDRFVSELWWSSRAFMEEGMIGNLTLEFKTLREQLAAREYETVKEKKIRIETKKEMRDRVGYSPDHADAFVMLTELFKRKGAQAGRASKAPGGVNRQFRRAVKQSKLEMKSEAFAGEQV